MPASKSRIPNGFKKALAVGRPPNVVKLFPKSNALLVSGKYIDRAMLARGKVIAIAGKAEIPSNRSIGIVAITTDDLDVQVDQKTEIRNKKSKNSWIKNTVSGKRYQNNNLRKNGGHF
jgi:hypothetical protein